MVKPWAACESAPDPDGAQRHKRARACNSAGPPRIATPTTTLPKQEMLWTEFIVTVLEMQRSMTVPFVAPKARKDES
jgi:hypothetical protein